VSDVGSSVGTLLGTGAFAAALTFLLTSLRSEREHRRAQAEALFFALGAWVRALFAYHHSVFEVARGKLTYNQALEMVHEDGDANEVGVQQDRISILTAVYFPQHQALFDALIAARDLGADTEGRFRREYGEVGSACCDKYLEPMRAVLNAIDDAEDGFRLALKREAAWINSAAWWLGRRVSAHFGYLTPPAPTAAPPGTDSPATHHPRF
jgi:hypothetical protein